MSSRHGAEPQNHLLAALPASEQNLLGEQLKPFPLDQGDVLQEPDERIQFVYFPLGGMISLLAVMSDGTVVETAAVGREGALGIQFGLGVPYVHTRAVILVSGGGLRMPATPFKKMVRESERLRDLIIRYRELRLAQTQQFAACNALHSAESRLTRWLLHTSDIIGSDTVPLTQEIMSQLLAVRRTTVTALARNLLRNDAIAYSRGRIEILDRNRLKNYACECYEVLQRLSASLLTKSER